MTSGSASEVRRVRSATARSGSPELWSPEDEPESDGLADAAHGAAANPAPIPRAARHLREAVMSLAGGGRRSAYPLIVGGLTSTTPHSLSGQPSRLLPGEAIWQPVSAGVQFSPSAARYEPLIGAVHRQRSQICSVAVAMIFSFGGRGGRRCDLHASHPAAVHRARSTAGVPWAAQGEADYCRRCRCPTSRVAGSLPEVLRYARSSRRCPLRRRAERSRKPASR